MKTASNRCVSARYFLFREVACRCSKCCLEGHPAVIFRKNEAMRHFLSHDVGKIRSGASSRSFGDSMFSAVPRATPARNLFLTLLVVCSAFLSCSFAQQPLLTSRGDISRSGVNTNETLLTPTNVSKNSFGRLFSVPVDYVVMAQPLYVPNVNIPGQGAHNVIYIVTQADSVYAIDADTGAQPRSLIPPPTPCIWWRRVFSTRQSATIFTPSTSPPATS